jgi:hypothetical protein
MDKTGYLAGLDKVLLESSEQHVILGRGMTLGLGDRCAFNISVLHIDIPDY